MGKTNKELQQVESVESVENTVDEVIEGNDLLDAELLNDEADAALDEAQVELVKMVNDEGKEANVHPLEVENYKVGNWKVKE